MNWIRQEKRLAIYLRDGLACAWCGASVEDGTILSLDHVTPHSAGGANDAANLVTACKRCNDSRGARSVASFSRAVAEYLDRGADPREIARHVRATCARKIDVAAAREMIARRGSIARVIAERQH